MSFPELQSTQAYAKVEVRVGRSAVAWSGMKQVYSGSCDAEDKWHGREGEKLSACYCLMPDDPNSTMSLPVTISGIEGLSPGEAVLRRFPGDN